jgi:hypothetical protein
MPPGLPAAVPGERTASQRRSGLGWPWATVFGRPSCLRPVLVMGRAGAADFWAD